MNRYYPHTIIAQEGWSFIISGLVLSILFTCLCGWCSLPFWAFTLFCLNFFRDPARNIPEAPDAILSPADGRIVVVERATDPYRQTDALKISIFMNIFNVHSQRAPASGYIDDVQYSAGKFINASLDKSSQENERNAVLMTTRTGRELTFVQIAGLIARRILCYTNKGDNIMRGERYGFIRFGSRVDVYLPLDATANVAIGDKVRASETILAYLPLEQSTLPDPDSSRITTSKSVAESRLKADVEAQHQSEPSEAQTTTQPENQHLQANTAEANQLAAETTKLKVETEQARQAAEQAKIKANTEIAQLKAQAEQERAKIEQAKAEIARLKAEQQAEAEKLKAEQEAKAEAEKLKAEQEAKAKAEAEKLKAEQEAKAKAEAEKLKAEQEAKAKAEAEKLKAEQEAAIAKAQAEQMARAQAETKAKEEAIAKAKAETEAKLKAEAEAKARAAAEMKAKMKAEAEAKAKAEADALAEIAARPPIVRREVFASVPEPWQTIEPREVIIRTEIKNTDNK